MEKIIKHKKYLLIIFALTAITTVGFMFFSKKDAPEATAGWWNDNWSYRKAIVINHSYVTGDLTDFPALISLTDTSLGAHAQADGDDIVFIDSEGNKLSHEIESFAPSTGVLVAWVKIPSLSSTDDTVINMYYGNAVIEDQQDTTNVWDENFAAVWHFPDNNLASTTDSTRFNHDGYAVNNASTTASGKIDGSMKFDGTDDYLDMGTDIPLTGAMTACAWVWADHLTSAASGENDIIMRTVDFSNVDYYLSVNPETDDNLTFAWINSGTPQFYTTTSNLMGENEWFYVCGVRVDEDEVYIYINGQNQPTSLTGDATVPSFSGNTYISANESTDWNGKIDEIKLSDIARSTAWIETEYANQASTTLFLSVQAEEVGPGPVGYWTFDDPSAGSGQGGTVYDESGQGNNGTIQGNPVQMDESMCVSGKCLYLDGTDDYIEVSDIDP